MQETKKIIPIRLSNSSLDVLHECERKWQLERLLVDPSVREENEHTVFGRAYGAGIANYLVHQNTDLALYTAWLNYFPEMESDNKNQALCVIALLSAFPKLDTLLMEYEVVSFNGKPAVELSFRLNINEHYYFVGYIDVVLRNRISGVHIVVDAKSTGLQLYELDPLYKNSGQTIGYSIALDRVAGEPLASYSVGYIVAQINARSYTVKTQTFFYNKTILDRLQWFMSLGMDVAHLEQMAELDFYPKRGTSCLKYNRPCRYFGLCGLHSSDVLKKREEDVIEYDFVYDLNELIEDHVKRIS